MVLISSKHTFRFAIQYISFLFIVSTTPAALCRRDNRLEQDWYLETTYTNSLVML